MYKYNDIMFLEKKRSIKIHKIQRSIKIHSTKSINNELVN